MTMIQKISEQPVNSHDSETVIQILRVAESYLYNADRLIYSYGSKTFLSGYDLFDPEYDGKGNIDCSTFMLLVLAGIPFEDSPYNAGTAKDLKLRPFIDMQFTCFSQIPDKYLSIAERIGIPEIAGPKGLDLEKAAAMGLSNEQLMSKIKGTGITRRTVELAKHFYEKDELFSNPDSIMPGDIVFYQADNFFLNPEQKKENPLEVTHVGIVSMDTEQMINSSGYFSKERAKEKGLSAVSLSPVFGKRTPVFFSRPVYKKQKTTL